MTLNDSTPPFLTLLVRGGCSDWKIVLSFDARVEIDFLKSITLVLVEWIFSWGWMGALDWLKEERHVFDEGDDVGIVMQDALGIGVDIVGRVEGVAVLLAC